jgi:hypothetical protein
MTVDGAPQSEHDQAERRRTHHGAQDIVGFIQSQRLRQRLVAEQDCEQREGGDGGEQPRP